ncbi:MAG: sulfatase-like hydrolase/transferase, partial [Planctomycetota bacterium]
MLFILADDLGYGDVGCYGAPDVRTPHLDALAAQGLQMTQMRSNCTVCSPTRAAILSGRYADRAGVPGVIRTNAESNFGYFAPNLNTVTDRFRQAGYETAAIGKWHLGLRSPNLPNERGFDHFHGFLGDMMDDYYTHLRGGKNFMRLNQETINPQGHASDLFSQWSIDYLRERDQSPNPKPFFLYLAYNAPHFPIQPPDRWLQRVRDREPSIPMARALNVALVEHLDDCVGRVLKCLDQLGLRDNTMVVFTSDNGGSLRHAQRNFPWRDGKQSHYDGGLRVPAIIRYPGVISKGSKSNQPAMTFDLTRTMLEIADAKIDPATDACSLQPVFAGKPMPE